jgi:hypothetical protein
MSERLDKLRRGVEAVTAGRLEEVRDSVYAFSDDAAYHIPGRDLTIRGRADIEALLKGMGGVASIRLRDMIEHGTAVLATADIDNKMPEMEYQGPLAIVWRFNESDEIVEQWNFRG